MAPALFQSMASSANGQRKPQKRKRTVISCTECHRRKQKCDRKDPCCNCIKRGTQSLCHYEIESKGHQVTRSRSGESESGLSPSETSVSTNKAPMLPPAQSGSGLVSELQDQIRDFGYSSHGNHNSGSLLRATILYGGPKVNLLSSPSINQQPLRSDANRKYKELVRQLPSRTCIDILVQTFFSEINWQYDLIDEASFTEHLAAWGKISYSDLQESFGRLSIESLMFPALLFQVLAQALLFHTPDDETIASLMTIPEMSFQDLGTEYSDIGAELLTLLGKNHITIAVIQAGLLRASFLKSSGKVIEAWHALGTTIRDAQEIGLHTGKVPSSEFTAHTNRDGRRQSISLVGHKIWIVLHIWDIHMAVVLGRPIVTDFQIDRFAATIEDNESRDNLFSHWHTEDDLPRPFDVILAGYNVAYRYFKDIHQMENSEAYKQDYARVEHIHAAIKKNLENLPSWCRLENAETKFDQLHGCQWLPVAREVLTSLIHLVLLTLHRPFIFSVSNSRTEALKSGISILRAQERLFQQSQPHQHKVFNPVYASFDAIVLIAAVCLIFPNFDPELRTECIGVIERGVQRLGIIGQSNPMARSAHGVVFNLYHHLQRQMGISETTEDTTAALSNSIWAPSDSDIDPSNGAPSEISFDALLPPRPTHDLFFDHISSTQMPFANTSDEFSLDLFTLDVTNDLNFEGVFSDSSFWNFMNELNN